MKITIAFADQEKEDAAACVAAIQQLHPRMKVRKSDAHPPFKHLYLTTKNAGNRCDSKKNT